MTNNPKHCGACGGATFVRNGVRLCTMDAEHAIETGDYCYDCGEDIFDLPVLHLCTPEGT